MFSDIRWRKILTNIGVRNESKWVRRYQHIENKILDRASWVCTPHSSLPHRLSLSSPMCVWQGRRECAAGRVSRWAVSGGGGPWDAFTALCFKGYKPPWVFVFLFVFMFWEFWMSHRQLSWTVCLTQSSIWRCGWGMCQRKKSCWFNAIWNCPGWCQRHWWWSHLERVEGSSRLSQLDSKCFKLKLISGWWCVVRKSSAILYKQHRENTHAHTSLQATCSYFVSNDSTGFLFYLAPTRYPSIS